MFKQKPSTIIERVHLVQCFPEKARNKLACSTTGLGRMECGQDENKDKLSELSLNEVMAATNSERTEVSEVAPSTDPNDSLSEICEDLFASGMSETIETEKEALSEESLRLSGRSDSCMVENRSHENLHGVFSDKQTERQGKTSNFRDVVSLKTEKQGVETLKTQNVENKTSVSDEEDVMSKAAGKQGIGIIVQTANTKEEFISLNREQHGREMKLQTDKRKDTTSKEVVSKKADNKDGTNMQSVESFSNEETARYKQGENATRAEDLTKEQCCQVNFSLDDAKTDELKALKEKLAISKKDTETMKKLLEDVRHDYEDLQKSFEKREIEAKSRAFVEQVTKVDDEMNEKAQLNRKTSKKESKVLSTSDEKARPKSSEKRKVGERKVDSSALTCPCFTQNLRKIVTDVTEDFKDVISVVKQSFLNQSESFGNEFAMLKDEYRSSLERKASEINALEETIRGLQARIREGEREAVDYRSVISTAFEEKKKLCDDIHGLKEELVKGQHENEINRADFEGIKHGLKKYCTAEEYEELERLNFKFSDGREVEGTLARRSESCEDVTELRNKVAKFYPVLKKAKKEISKLKKEKKDVENRLLAKVSQAAEKEMHLSNKLNRALSDLKENDVNRAELTEKLEQSTAENTKFDVKIKKLEEQTEHLHSQHSLELRTANEKLKLSDASLRLLQVKYDELQEDYGRLRNGYNDLKKFLEDMSTRERKKIVDDFFDNVSSTEHLLKDDYSQRKQLKAEKEKNEEYYREIESLRKDMDIWKEMAGEEKSTGVRGYLQDESEDLKEEIRDQRTFIKELVTKKKEHAQIIKKLHAENKSLKLHLKKASERPATCSLDSDDEISCLETGNDGTTTQERRVRFGKKKEMRENFNHFEFSDEEEDSLRVHFSDDNNDVLQDGPAVDII